MGVSNLPLFTVIIPTCNRPKDLMACLQCIAPGTQTLSADQYEVLVTDDGRERPAGPLLEEQFPWARWTEGPAKGPAANRNHGASQAHTEWLVFVDDDCLPEAGWLEAYRDAVVCGDSVLEGKTTSNDLRKNDPCQEAPVNLLGGCLWSCNFAIQNRLFAELSGFDDQFGFWGEDVDFHRRVLAHGIKPKFIPEAAVDHPPRSLPPAWKRVSRWRHRLLDFSVEGQGALPTVGRLVLHAAKVRVSQAIASPNLFRGAWHLASSGIELTLLTVVSLGWFSQDLAQTSARSEESL